MTAGANDDGARRATDGDVVVDRAAPAMPAPARREGRPHVLLVEEDLAFARTLGEWLEQGRYRVTSIANRADAIRKIALLQYDGLICEVDIADAYAFEILRASKSIRPLVPVMIITANRADEIASDAVRNHADEMLLKPFDRDSLLRRLQDMIVTGRIARRAGPRTVLAISAHPDDAEIGIGGTLMDHVANGDRVIHLVMTDGEGGG